MAQDHLHAEIVEHAGRRFLFWLESDGDELIFHQVTTVRGVGIADLKTRLRPVVDITDDRIWALLTEDGFAALCAHVIALVRPLEEDTAQ